MGQNSDDDLTASIYVMEQLKQITHCLNVLSGQVEPDAEEYSYQFSVKIIGLPEISSKETATETSSFCVKLFQEMGAEVSIFDTDIVHRVSTRDCVTLFTILFESSQVSSQQLHMGRVGMVLLVGVCRPVHQILTLFRPKKMQFSTPVLTPDF